MTFSINSSQPKNDLGGGGGDSLDILDVNLRKQVCWLLKYLPGLSLWNGQRSHSDDKNATVAHWGLVVAVSLLILYNNAVNVRDHRLRSPGIALEFGTRFTCGPW